MLEFVARRYDTGAVVRATVADGRWQCFEPSREQQHASLPWLAPGWVDLQVNGWSGIEFTDRELTVENVACVLTAMDCHGVVRTCPTVTTQSHEVLRHAMATLARACEEDSQVADRFAGIHLEGPFLSPEDGPRGAHPLEHVRPPDWDEFQRLQEAADGRIRLVTLSPEYEEAPAFISKAVSTGVLVAIGHTAADSRAIQAAVDAGAQLSTHLGNGAHRTLPRHPNYLWDQLAHDRLTASLIVDGFHLPPAVVKTFVRAKTPGRTILVSDVVGTAGRPPGRYDDSPLGSVEILEDGRIVIAGQRQLLAGAFRTIEYGVANVMRFAGVGLEEAVTMASLRPAELIGLSDFGFRKGAWADAVLFRCHDDRLEITATLNRGRLVHGTLPASE